MQQTYCRYTMESSSHPSHVIINMRLNKTYHLYQKVPLTDDMLVITPNTPVPPPPAHDSTCPYQSLCYHALRFSLKDLSGIELTEDIGNKMAPKLLTRILACPANKWGAEMACEATDLLDASAVAFEIWKNALLNIKQLLAVKCTIEIILPTRTGSEDSWVRYPAILPRNSPSEPQIHFTLPAAQGGRKRSRRALSPAPRKRVAFELNDETNKENDRLECIELISCPKKPTFFGLHRGACHTIPIPFAIEQKNVFAASHLFSASVGTVQTTSTTSLELVVFSSCPAAGRVSEASPSKGLEANIATYATETYSIKGGENDFKPGRMQSRPRSLFYIP